MITARREDRLQKLKKELEEKHGNIKVKVIVADLTKSEDVDKIIEETKEDDIGLLINNAGELFVGVIYGYDECSVAIRSVWH